MGGVRVEMGWSRGEGETVKKSSLPAVRLSHVELHTTGVCGSFCQSVIWDGLNGTVLQRDAHSRHVRGGQARRIWHGAPNVAEICEHWPHPDAAEPGHGAARTGSDGASCRKGGEAAHRLHALVRLVHQHHHFMQRVRNGDSGIEGASSMNSTSRVPAPFRTRVRCLCGR